MKPTAREIINEAQAGFTKGRGTVEQIGNVRTINETYIEHQNYVYHNFIDFKKAFGRVWHEALWLTMLKHNFRPSIVSVLKSLYEHAKSTVLIGDKYSPWFKSNVGVRQGCVLSPTLFNIFLEQIMMDTLDSFDTFNSGVTIGGQTLTNLRFADDIDLICSNEEDLRQLTLLLDVTARKYGMEVSAEKSKILIIGKERKTLAQPIQINGDDLEMVDSFEYLGSKITADGKCSEEICNRLAMATSSLINLNNIWKNSNITIKTKYRLLRTITLAIALYGCETWTLDAVSQNKINAFEMKCYRKLLRIPFTAHRTNDSVKEELKQKVGNIEMLISVIRKRQLKWFGHVTRHSDKLPLANNIMHGRPPGKRGRGRHRTSWIQNSKEYTGLSALEAVRAAHDREEWKRRVEDSTVLQRS